MDLHVDCRILIQFGLLLGIRRLKKVGDESIGWFCQEIIVFFELPIELHLFKYKSLPRKDHRSLSKYHHVDRYSNQQIEPFCFYFVDRKK